MCGVRLQLAGDGEHPQRQVLVRHAVSKGAVKRRPEVHPDPQSGGFHSQLGPRATCCSTHIVCVRKLQQGLSVQSVACGTRSGVVCVLTAWQWHMFIVVITRERNNRKKKKERRKVVSCPIKSSVFLWWSLHNWDGEQEGPQWPFTVQTRSKLHHTRLLTAIARSLDS